MRQKGRRYSWAFPPNSSSSPFVHVLQVKVQLIERFAFYERAKQTFAIVATG